ncbi:MAG: hypothetical protein J1F65_02630 [Clostridiales bacterium]|nr:hypothetical protein [Clostridiales bacterium]
MKKVRILSLILSLVFCLTLCLAACDNGGVDEHDHVWDEGVVTTEPTCYAEGVRTISCTVKGCKQTKTVPVGTIPHIWNQGEVTTESKCNEAGVMTYKCTATGCTATKTEPIGKSQHRWNDGVVTKPSEFSSAGVRTFTCLDCQTTREESIPAHADFVEQFYTDEENKTDWNYGVVTEFDVSGNLQFADSSVDNGVWTAQGVEIGRGVVKVNSAKAAVVYTFTDDLPNLVKAMFSISFEGGVVKAYLVVVGEQTSVINLNEEQKAEWTYESEEGVEVKKGDKVYLVLDSDAATVEGALSFTIYAACLHVWDQGTVTTEPKCNAEGVKTFKCVSCEETYTQSIDKVDHEWDEGKITKQPTEESDGEKTFTCKNCDETKKESIPKLEPSDGVIADFDRDFNATLAGESNWEVGKVSYDFGTETFTFSKLTAGDEAFKSSDPWIEIKGGWMAANGMIGFAYRFDESAKAEFDFTINCADSGSCSVRWALKGSDGVIKTNSGKASWGGSGKDVTVKEVIGAAEGDTLYVLVNKEGDSDQSNFSLVITAVEEADFGADFASTLLGQTNWEVGAVSYDWGTENFDFSKVTSLSDNGEAFRSESPFMEIKGDWMAIGTMVGLAYNFQGDASVSFNFELHTEGNFSVRWALKDKNGNIKTNGGKASWGGSGADVTVKSALTVEEGDVLFILVQKEDGSSTDQCRFNHILSFSK